MDYRVLKKELSKIIEKNVDKELIIYPMGEYGALVKGILNGQMGIKEKYILDNQLCKNCEWIYPVSFLEQISCERYLVILACENTKYLYTIIESLKPYNIEYYDLISQLGNNSEEIIPENYSRNVYGNRLLVEDQIRDMLHSGIPFAAGRLGATECGIAYEHCRMRLGIQDYFSESTVRWLCSTSGFFTEREREKKDIARYADMTINALKDIDIHLVWGRCGEAFLLRNYAASNAIFVQKDIIHFPWHNSGYTWLNGLYGKRVLVISPFSKSVQTQYDKRKKLFTNENNLPDFELITYQALQTQMGESRGFKDWFEAYQYMEDEVLQIDFDVALIGCGAYGYPLTAAIKKSGRQAIEMCSSIQLMFGIKGKRWELRDYANQWWNDAWIYPLETPPQHYKKIEDGAYWG